MSGVVILGGPASGAVTAVGLLTKTTFQPIPTAVLVGGVAWYLRARRRVVKGGQPWPRWRTGCFAAAAVVFAAATLAGMDRYSRDYFAVYAVQNVLLAMVVPVFLTLAGPLQLAAYSLEMRGRVRLRQTLNGRVVRVLTHPFVTWVVTAGFYALLYFGPLYAPSIRHSWVHQLVYLLMLAVGSLLLWPDLGADLTLGRAQPGWRIAHLLLQLPFWTLLGLILESENQPLTHGAALSQLHAGGGVLWTAGTMAALICCAGVLVTWLFREQKTVDAEQDTQDEREAAMAQLAAWQAGRRAANEAEAAARVAARERALARHGRQRDGG